MRKSQSKAPAPKTVRPLWLAFLSAIVSLLAVFIASSAPIPLYNVYRDEDSFTNADISMTIVVYGVSVLAALLFMGRISNYLGRRITAVSSLALLAAGSLLFLTIHDVATLLIARALMGVGAGLASSNVTAYSVDAAPPKHVGLATVVASQLPMLGLAIGAVVSGALVQFGPSPRQLSYMLSSFMLIAAIVLVIFSPETVPRAPGVWRSLRPSLRIPRRIVRLLPAAAAVYLATWATGAFFQAFVPALVADELHTRSPLILGFVLAAYMATSAVGAPLGAHFSPAAAQRWAMIAFLAGMIGIILAVSTENLALFIVATLVAGASQGVAISSATRGLLAGADVSERAPILSVIYLTSYSATVLPSLLAGQLSNVFSLPQIAIGYGALTLIATLVTLLGARNPDPDTELSHSFGSTPLMSSSSQ